MFLQTSNKTGKYRARITAVAAVLIVVLIAFLRIFAPHFVSALFTSIARPFWRMEFSIGSGSLNSPQALLAENESLKRELQNLQVRLQTAAAIETENAQLKALFGRDISFETGLNNNRFANSSTTLASASLVTQKRILAPVLVRPPFAPFDEFIIDGGNDLNFKVGDKVYASANVLIGAISDALSGTSKVMLYSSPGKTYQVLIGSSSAPALAIGRGGGQYSAQLPRNAVVSAGDFVIAPSLNDKPFGIVSAVESDPAQAFETVLFAPPVDIYQIKWVLVERK